MKKYYIITLLLLSIFTFPVLAQRGAKPVGEMVDVLSAMSEKYENSNVDLYTGRNSVSIPLYTYKDQDFEIPISVSNVSDGFKSNATIGYVGLGWNLNHGGYVTRQIVGVADEQGGAGLGSYFSFSGSNGISSFERLFEMGGPYDGYGSEYKTFIWKLSSSSTQGFETTPDIFSFNFLGHKGSFVHSHTNNECHVFDTNRPHGEYKIRIIDNLDRVTMLFYLNIEITTGDGYIYTFKNKDYPHSNRIGFHETPEFKWHPSLAYTSQWFLDEIKAPNGRKVVFKYGADELVENAREYYASNLDWGENIHLYYKKETNIKGGYKSTIERIAPLEEIKIDNTSIKFKYEDRKKEILPTNPTMEILTSSRLKSITVNREGNETPIKTCNFTYSYSDESERPVFFLKEVNIPGLGKYNMNYYYEEEAFPYLGRGFDHWGFHNNTRDYLGAPVDATTAENDEEQRSDHLFPEFRGAVKGMLRSIKYPTGGYTNFYYEGHTYGYKVTRNLKAGKQNHPYLASVWNEKAGGVRIKKITNYSSPTDSTYRRFEYLKLDDEGYFDEFSGILLHTPRYYRRYSANASTYYSHHQTVSAMGNFIYTKDKNHIGYSEVIEYLPGSSYIQYKFSDYRLLPDLAPDLTNVRKICDIYSSSPAYVDNFFTDYDSRHTQRGKLISKKMYVNQHDLVYSEDYIYNYGKNLDYLISVKPAVSYYYMQKLFVEEYPLERVVKTTYPQNDGLNPVAETTTFVYNKLGQVINKEVQTSDGKRISDARRYPYELRSTTGNQNFYDDMCNKNFVKYPIMTQRSVSGSGIISGEFHEYSKKPNGLYFLSSIDATELSKPLVASDFAFGGYLEFQNLFNYNDMGNIVMKRNKNGIHTVYIWGYNNQHIIAKIEGNIISYDQITNIIDENMLKNIASRPEPTEDDLSIVNSFRSNSMLKDVMVTTYTYKPLIGISSITAPNGVSTYYEYDKYGNLINVRDNQMNIEKVYRQNYINK